MNLLPSTLRSFLPSTCKCSWTMNFVPGYIVIFIMARNGFTINDVGNWIVHNKGVLSAARLVLAAVNFNRFTTLLIRFQSLKVNSGYVEWIVSFPVHSMPDQFVQSISLFCSVKPTRSINLIAFGKKLIFSPIWIRH